MFDLLFLPFKLVWELICIAFKLCLGVFEFVFGLIGGALELLTSIAVFAVLIGFIRLAIVRRKTCKAHHEEFTSFYTKDGKVE